MTNEEFGCFTAVLILSLAIVLIFVIAIMSNTLTDLRSDMEAVGIEKFVRCNNTHSNWVEIVWKSEVK